MQKRLYRILIYLLLCAFAASILLPIGWVIGASFKDSSEFYMHPWKLPKKLILENYVNAWKNAHMGDYFLNSVTVTFLAIAMLLAVAIPAAYAISRYSFPGVRFIRGYFSAGLFINVSYIVVPIFLMIISVGKIFNIDVLLNNRFVLAIIYASTALPFTLHLFIAYMEKIPHEYEEAASVDGCGYLHTMVGIIIPMVRPAIITVILFNCLSFWNEYIIALTLMSNDAVKTLPVGLMNLMKAQNAAAKYGELYAGLVIIMLPTIILYVAVQKKLLSGMSGGIKG